MKVGITMGQSRTLQLRHALLVYGNDRFAYVTRHDVWVDKSGAPRLGSGKPADLEFIRRLSESVQAAVPAEVLPACVLCRTPDRIVWWSRRAVRPMYFDGRSDLAEVSGEPFPQPALVWKIEGRRLFVRALAANERPDASTQLFVAPYWNVNNAGMVCLGTTKRPARLDIETLRGWEDGFFASRFTGPIVSQPQSRAKGGTAGLWKSLAGKRSFPTRLLIEAGETLGEFVAGGDSGDA